ncbi:uncharacterized protein LOC130591086 [Beta vulgaris subsp. vulgaris]|uniref:uncharacterized protein LOC130591086 n=1 Tax=Beta vulgaris subsp. vulgaris TaxID=3555 RepID=UPI002546F6E4|nr:uncharacterized protein LOC130591086 [Beta vulgaris subsp. vulgaris]
MRAKLMWLQMLSDVSRSILLMRLEFRRETYADEFRKLEIEVVPRGSVETLCAMSAEPALFQELREKQKNDPKLEKVHEAKAHGRAENFEVDSEGGLKFMSRWCVPNDLELKKKILEEAHCTPYSVHPRGDKLYKDLKANFWWPCMKREVAEFVARCLVCQKIKIEHQRPGGLLQPLPIPAWNSILSRWTLLWVFRERWG